LRHPDVRVSVGLLAVFSVLLVYSFFMPKPPHVTVGVGPAFVPQLVLVTMIGLTLVVLVQGLLAARRSSHPRQEKKSDGRPLLGMLATVATILLMDYLGIFVGIALFVIAVMVIAGERRPFHLIAMAVGTPLVIYLLFTVLLEVQFPAGWMF